MRRRILILGGSRFQVPLIRLARDRGLHVVTCDFLPDNPGHRLAHEYHDVSTTDREAVLALARRVGIDAVASMASDPAMQSVAYVAHALGLPGPPPAAIVRLTDKGVFRRLMSDIGLPTPGYEVLDATAAAATDPIAARPAASPSRKVVKPVDAAGSRGVTVLAAGGDLAAALRRAREHSRSGRCIVEDYIDGEQIEGDGFLQEGSLVHCYLGDQSFYTRSGNCVPLLTRWPTRQGEAVLAELVRQVEAIARASGYLDGPVNIEARIAAAGGVYVIELGPRNGGNHIPILQQRLTGFDFVGRVLDAALGIAPADFAEPAARGVGAVYVLHAERDGVFAGLRLSDLARERIVLLDLFRQVGEPVLQYAGSNTSIGCALLQFESLAESDRLLAEVTSHLSVQVV